MGHDRDPIFFRRRRTVIISDLGHSSSLDHFLGQDAEIDLVNGLVSVENDE